MSWLLVSPASPIASFSEILTELFVAVQIPATLLAILLGGNVHGGRWGETIYWLLVFLQWSMAGFGLSALFKLRGQNRAARTRPDRTPRDRAGEKANPK